MLKICLHCSELKKFKQVAKIYILKVMNIF